MPFIHKTPPDTVLKLRFQRGDKVQKPKGYSFNGTVIGTVYNLAGEEKVIAELTTENGLGMLHIFSPNQLEKRN